MTKRRLLWHFMPLVLLVLPTGPCHGADDWKKTLQKKLEESFQPSQIGYKGSIKSAGTLVVLQSDGVQAGLQDQLTLPTNVFENGKLSVGGGFLSSLENANRTGRSSARALGTGQKLYIQSIGVKDKEIKFIVFTADEKEDTVLGTTRAQYMKAAIAFRFGESLDSMQYDAVVNAINQVLVSPKAAAAPKSISLGQTTAEVEQALGKPEKIVNLGTKTIYTYKDLKVVFVEGKVSDVQ